MFFRVFFYKITMNDNTHDEWKDLCSSCHAKTCCSDHLPPFVSTEEFEEIKIVTKRDDFVTTRIINNVKKNIMKTKDKTDECIFFDSERGCTIYQNRPFDCKIFPFDIRKINGEFTWIVFSCNPNSDWKWTESILERFESEWLTPKTIEELEYFTNTERLEQSGKAFSYEVLRKVRIEHPNITIKKIK